MNSKELKTKLEGFGKLSAEEITEISDYVMKANGIDVNKAKETNSEDLDKVKAENENLKSQISTLNDQIKGFADYEDLKKFKTDADAKEEADRKSTFLKNAGLKDGKYADLLLSKIDFSKATYDSEKGTYTGLDDDVKALKESYSDLFASTKPSVVEPDSKSDNTDVQYGFEKILDSRDKRLY